MYSSTLRKALQVAMRVAPVVIAVVTFVAKAKPDSWIWY